MAIVLRGGKGCQEYTLLDAAVATTNGEWVNVSGWRRMSVHIKGITTATVEVRGSCAPTKPADTGHEVLLGSALTADTIYEVSAKLKWIKVRMTAWTTGTIYAYVVGDELKGGL